MKKILTAMTAISMTLQANDNLNQENKINTSSEAQQFNGFDVSENSEMDQYLDDDIAFSMSENNEGTLGASGSFLSVNKFVSLESDADLSGTVTAGDTLSYEIFTNNFTTLNASGAFFDDVPDSNTSLMIGSVTSTHGSVIEGNIGRDEKVSVDMGVVAAFETALVSFSVLVKPIPDGMIREISNQALIATDNLGYYLSDDPHVFGIADPTVIKAVDRRLFKRDLQTKNCLSWKRD